MKRSRIIAVVLITVSILTLVCTAFSFSAFAENKDYSRPGSTSKITLDSRDILKALIGDEISAAEEKYLALYGEHSISYVSHIPASSVKVTSDEDNETVLVEAFEYTYKTSSDLDMVWYPERAVISGTEKMLEKDEDGAYRVNFEGISEANSPELFVYYKADVNVSASVINYLLNKTYRDAITWSEYEKYIEDLAEYEVAKKLYRDYLVAKSIYDEQTKKYNTYIEDLAQYETDLASYQDYLVKLAEYNSLFEKYQNYLEERKNYEKNLESYNRYVENIAKVKKQLAIIDGSKVRGTSLGRSVYHAVNGNLVTLVVQNKDLVDNDFVGASGSAVDIAGETTESLRVMYKEYFACETEDAKYTYYTLNYEKFKENFISLFQSLDKLYQNGKIRLAIDEEGYKDKFEILLAQLYYLVLAISDEPVPNFDGTEYYGSSYMINRRTPLSVHEGKEYIKDENCATPISGGYPAEVKKPEITEVSEPKKPDRVVEPIKPEKVENPGKAPEEIEKPVAPSVVTPPFDVSEPYVSPDGVAQIIEAYKTGGLYEREPVSSSKNLSLEIALKKRIFGVREITVSFKDQNGRELYNTLIESGTYAEYLGAIPVKNEDNTAKYIFDGWQDENGNPVDTTALESETDVVLYPRFIEEKKSYKVTWEIDGVLYYSNEKHGSIPAPPFVPEKSDVEKYRYDFIGWHKELEPVSGSDSTDRYYAKFEKNYIVPLYDVIRGEYIGGADVVKTDTEVLLDCTVNSVGVSYSALNVELSEILERVSFGESIVLKTSYYKAEFPYSSIVAMKDAGVQSLSLVPVQSANDFYFTPKFLSNSTDKITADFRFELEVTSLKCQDPENTVVYTLLGDERSFIRANIDYSSFSFTATAGLTYHVVSEYEINMLPSGPVYLEADKTVASAGMQVKVKSAANPGVRIQSLFYINSNGERVEIKDGKFTMPLGGVSVGVQYEYIEYTVNFTSGGKIISTRVYKYGEMPTVPQDPVKTNDAKYSYKFAGWSAIVSEVTRDANYEAIYEKIPLPPKDEVDGLKISPSILKKLVLAALIAVFTLFAIVPCLIIVIVKTAARIRRKAPTRAKYKN